MCLFCQKIHITATVLMRHHDINLNVALNMQLCLLILVNTRSYNDILGVT